MAALEVALAADGVTIDAVAGHSFGGKVALRYAAERAGAPMRTWVLDADPSAAPAVGLDEARARPEAVLAALEQVPRVCASRAAFIDALVARGLERGIARWLAMSLDPVRDGVRLRLEPRAMRALLDSTRATDLWPAAAQLAAAGALHVVLGADSPAVPPGARDQLRALGADVHEIDAAGHWLHVDAPDAVVALWAGALAR